MRTRSRQTTDTVFMVRPYHFTFNSDTAADNHFQVDLPDLIEHAHQYALREFDDFVALLREHGVKVVVAQDSAEPATPDSIFPNNWFTTHDDGTIVLFPMYAPNRNQESTKEVIREVLVEYFAPKQSIDLRHHRSEGKVLEGTGCMILDREHRVAYACRSVRISEELFREYCELRHFRPLLFDAVDKQGQPIYHTNVMMALGETFAIICLESIPDATERASVVESLEASGHEIIEITLDQVYAFAGNMLALRNNRDKALLVMSQQALRSLSMDQVRRIQAHADIVAPKLDTIETLGGGSARCMMGEIYKH